MSLELNSDSGNLVISSSTRAQINSSISIVGTQTRLPITVIGEFKDIPPHLHQTYMQSMLMSYGSVDVNSNTYEEPKTMEEKKSEWRINKIVDLLLKKIS
jgi:hypothetical protein